MAASPHETAFDLAYCDACDERVEEPVKVFECPDCGDSFTSATMAKEWVNRSGPCVVCGRHLTASTGRHQEGKALYARINGRTVRVGAACESHFEGARKLDYYKRPTGDFIDPNRVALVRPAEPPGTTEPRSRLRTTDDRPSHGGA